MQEKVSAQYKNEIEMAKSQRDYELKKAVYDIEVNTKKAESEMAYQLQVPHRMHPRSKFRLRYQYRCLQEKPAIVLALLEYGQLHCRICP